MLFINPENDLVSLLTYVDTYTKSIGINEVEVDVRRIQEIVAVMVQDGHYPPDGVKKASAFRKLAVFISFFVALKPIINAFALEKIGDDLHKISNHQNAILALAIAIDSLQDAKIERDDGECLLTNPIKISRHSFVDIVDALTGVTPNSGVNLVAVLLEQMSYRQNPNCEFPLISSK